MIYITFLLVYIISKSVPDYHEPFNVYYKDLMNNYIDIDQYCSDIPCVLKCCSNDGEVLNHEGICKKASDDDIQNYSFTLMLWEAVAEGLKRLNKDIAFINNDNFVNGGSDELLTTKFYIQKNASLLVKNQQEKWVLVSPLEFCVDYIYDSIMESELKVAAIYRLDGAANKEVAYGQLFSYGIGLVASFVAVTCLLYRIPTRMRRPLSSILIMFSISIFAAYILKITQLSAVIAELPYFNDCRIISPVLYCFVLTSLCWSNLMLFDLSYRMCYFRQKDVKKRRFFDKHSCLRIIFYHFYGSGVPLLTTTAAIAIDKSDFFNNFYIMKSPFESCFANEWSTMIYLHIPVAILILFDCILFLRFIFIILEHREYILELVEKIPQLRNNPNIIMLTSKYRNIMLKKVFVVIFISCILEIVNVPTVPVVLYLTIHIYNICILITLLILMIFRKSTFASESQRSVESSKPNNDQLEAMQYLKDVKASMACIKLFGWNDKESEDKKKLIVWTTEVV